ncbi:MAG: hypothetical protein K6T78_04775 [Alicyclobacillus sp.]|nr:hypothetical protein [Alicyclobacillus sp.]
MKVFLFCIALLFAVYTGYDAYTLTRVGAVNDIPQLLGDGGGSLVFTVLVALGAINALWLPRVGAGVFLVATVVAVLVALLYQDTTSWYWAGGSVVLCGGQVALRQSRRHRLRVVSEGGRRASAGGPARGRHRRQRSRGGEHHPTPRRASR